MRIGIDARFYGPVGKGLGRYTQEVVDNIMNITGTADEAGSAFDFVVFLSPENFDEFICPRPNVRKVLLTMRWYSWQEQIIMPLYIWREHLDLIHFPHFNVPLLVLRPFVVTIHDLILTKFPTLRATTLSPWLYKLKNLAYRLTIFTAIRRARRVITVSEFTKQDIVSQFHVDASKITVTYEGVANLAKGRDSLFVAKLDEQETLAQFHISDRFVLYVGNAYPHKNLETLLSAFSFLLVKQPQLRLVLVGRDDYFYSRVKAAAKRLNLWQKENFNSPVIFPGYVPDSQLEVLYREAAVYVFPSLYEGFGLPPLEAMAKGCPVVCSDRASLPEVLGEAALYFNPEQPEDIARAVSEVLANDELRSGLIVKGYERAKHFSWWDCAFRTLEIYKEVLHAK